MVTTVLGEIVSDWAFDLCARSRERAEGIEDGAASQCSQVALVLLKRKVSSGGKQHCWCETLWVQGWKQLVTPVVCILNLVSVQSVVSISVGICTQCTKVWRRRRRRKKERSKHYVCTLHMNTQGIAASLENVWWCTDGRVLENCICM